MSTLAQWLAKYTWVSMLWLMRRGFMRRWQAGMLRLFPARSREKALRNHLAQNRFARRWGLRLLTFMYMVLLASLAITLTYFSVLGLFENGVIRTNQVQ